MRMSQADLATTLTELSGERWDQSKVSRIERAPENATARDLTVIAKALGVSQPWDLLPRAEEEPLFGIDPGKPLDPLVVDTEVLEAQLCACTPPAKTSGVPDFGPLYAACAHARRKPVVALLGKFDVGKSTIANTLLGQQSMPTGYQPATRLVNYLRHATDRPDWLLEDVLILDEGFDPARWEDEEHAHGSHHSAGNSDDGAMYALGFIDSPVLHSAVLLDLPGTENDTTDTDRATSAQVTYDVALFADTCQGFLSEGTLLRLGDVVRRLPLLQGQPPLANLIVVATHAHPGISDDQLHKEIMGLGVGRAWRQMGDTVLAARGEEWGRNIERNDLEARVFPFYRETDQRREPLLREMERVLGTVVPESKRAVFDDSVREAKGRVQADFVAALNFYRSLASPRGAVRTDIERRTLDEPQAQKSRRAMRAEIEEDIDRHRVESAAAVMRHVEHATAPETIEKLLRDEFHDRKDAQQNATARLVEKIQAFVEDDTKVKTKQLTKKIDGYLKHFEKVQLHRVDQHDTVTLPFNAAGAFAGGLAGLAGVGGLAAWAATLGNLGAYIIVAKAASVASALGLSMGGSAAWTAAVAAVGGPATLAIGIVVITAVAGWALFRGDWESRLARQLSKHLRKSKLSSEFCSRVDAYWRDTSEAFAAGADAVEADFQEHLEVERRMLTGGETADAADSVAYLEALRPCIDQLVSEDAVVPD
jgi:hypothetical protein